MSRPRARDSAHCFRRYWRKPEDSHRLAVPCGHGSNGARGPLRTRFAQAYSRRALCEP